MADTKGILLAMGMGPKPSPSSTPPSSVFDKLASASRSPTPQRSPGSMSGQQPNNGMQMGGKASQDDAGYVPDDNICGGCINYTKESGDCSKVEGPVDPGAGCRKYFEAANKSMGGDDDMLQVGEQNDPDDESLRGMNSV